MRPGRLSIDRSLPVLRFHVRISLFVAVFFLLVFTPQFAAALQNKPREARDMRGGRISEDDLTDYHDHYHDHSHDEHNFDEEGHKHVHWEL